jgi:hypothetical protein
MEQLLESDKNRIIEFIRYNDLDYDIIDNSIFKFGLLSYDKMVFNFYKYNQDYLIVKYDKNKDKGDPFEQLYTYYLFKNIPQLLEQLVDYDNSIHKVWWRPITNSIEIRFSKEGYTEDWYKEFLNNENWSIIDCDTYKSVCYLENRKCKLISPFTTIHHVSPINEYKPVELDKFYFEIHPITLTERNESYLIKILYNNEEILKEYINYIVTRKKGLRLFLNKLFSELN